MAGCHKLADIRAPLIGWLEKNEFIENKVVVNDESSTDQYKGQLMDFSRILEELTKIIAEKAPIDYDNLLSESEYQPDSDRNMSILLEQGENVDFLKKCYSLLLGRAADGEGLQTWANALNEGMPRETVIQGFKESPECLLRNTGVIDSYIDLPKQPHLAGIYIDITNFVHAKTLTGIQRVVVEVCSRLKSGEQCSFIIFNKRMDSFLLLDKQSVLRFFQDPRNCPPEPVAKANVSDFGGGCTFFDMDSAWHTPHIRSYIYKEFASQGVNIVSYIYDLIPIINPGAMTGDTLKKFAIYLAAVLKYSTLIITDSLNTENDLINVRTRIGCKKTPTLVTGLGVKPYVETDYQSEIPLEIPTQKYILFVGTLEPRKRQDLVLDAFLEVQKNNKNLSLVFIGKMGWGGTVLGDKIKKSKANNVRWYSQITDEALRRLYTNAYLNIYISNYEGYGLPVAEGLAAGQITLTSLNSSIYEAGQNYADYIKFNTVPEIVRYLNVYLENTELYNAKKNFIKSNYKPPCWDTVSHRIDNAITGLSDQQMLTANRQVEKIQHVSISIRPDEYAKNIQLQQKYGCCASEFVVITRQDLIDEFRNIESDIPLRVIDESVITNRDSNIIFSELDHLEKNWYLRSGLIEVDEIDEMFVMLDDDNYPIGKGSIDRFIDEEGRYKAYYFHNMLTWNHYRSSFDRGMQRARKNAMAFGTEFRAYASHCSQIINKTLFREAIEFTSSAGMVPYPSEWETYFNYAITHYPHVFHKSQANVLNWPAHPSSWPVENDTHEYLTENYHEYLYDDGHIYEGLAIEDQEEKAERRKKLLHKFEETQNDNTKLQNAIGALGLFHTLSKFEHPNGLQVFVSQIPKYIKIHAGTVAHIDINYKMIDSAKTFKGSDLRICFRQIDTGKNISTFQLNLQDEGEYYQEAMCKLPVMPSPKQGGEFYEFVLMADSKEFCSIDGPCKIFVDGT